MNDTNPSTNPPERLGWVPPDDDRNTAGIIWTCLATLFLCSWASIRLDTPDNGESDWSIVRRKLRWTLLTLIAPEFILYCAIGEWLGAYYIIRPATPEKTLTQAFFVLCGGFRCFDSEGEAKVWDLVPPEDSDDNYLYLQRVKALFKEFPELTTEQIYNESKTDYFTQALAAFQFSWFLLSVLLRLARKLPITELEIGTVANVLLSFVINFLWWKKPLDSRKTVNVGLDHPILQPSSDFRNMFWNGTRTLAAGMEKDSHLLILRSQKLSFMGFFSDYCHAIDLAANPAVWKNQKIKPYHPRVSKKQGTAMYAIIFLLFEVFGIAHLIGVFQSFPTQVEHTIWTAATGALIGLPFLTCCAWWLRHFNIDAGQRWQLNLIETIFTICFAGFILARLTLVVQALVCLRSQPAGAYTAVQWLNYIIHVG